MRNKTHIIIAITVIVLLVAGRIGLAYYTQQINALQNQLTEAAKQNTEMLHENSALKDQLSDKATEIKSLRDSLDYKEEELLDATARLDDKTSELDHKASEVSNLQAEINDIEEQISELTTRLHEKNLQIENITSRNNNNEAPGGAGPIAYLTFDDGPSDNTFAILDILAQEKIHATFFVTGDNQSNDTEAYNRIVENGHTLGNHTYTHDYSLIYQSVNSFMSDLVRLENFLSEKTGVQTNIMRFPGGSSNQIARRVARYDIKPHLIAAVTEQGYDYFDWNVDSGDAAMATPPVDDIVANVLHGADNVAGDIVVLLHDSMAKTTTVQALPQIISKLRDRGYVFERLNPGAIHFKHR